MDIATIGCAAAVRLDGTVISGIRLAYSVSAPIPVRCPSAESAALGRSATPEALPATLAAISAAVEADVQPRTSWRANRNFRMHIIRTLASLPGASSAPSNFRRPPHAENHTLHRQRQGAGTFL